MGKRKTASSEERRLVEMARMALARQRHDDAMKALTRHEQKYPGGELAEMRDALVVIALAGQGRWSRARARAKELRRRYPKSLLLPVVEDALRKEKRIPGSPPGKPGP